MRYRAVVAYDGGAYLGFQRQAGDAPTIQLALETAIAQVTGCRAAVIPAGRTDTGVPAEGQGIAFAAEGAHGEMVLLRALNAVLPPDIALQSLAPAPGFHPRFDARSRLYTYQVINAAQRQPLLRQRAWHIWSALDLGAMRKAAALLVGEHDFATFGQPPAGTSTVRVLYRSEWLAQEVTGGLLLSYVVEGNAFLQHMVRRIVAALVDVGRGAWTVADFAEAVASADLARARALAPPHGLVLTAVSYP